jgi:hypothetical protein
LLLAAAACDSSKRPDEGTSVASAAAATPQAHVKSQADSSIDATVEAVTNDVTALRDAPNGDVAAKLPAHEKLVTGMLDTFESRIRAMHVTADPAWTSVIDSVRTDLVQLPKMPSASLATFLPQHLNRVMRIVACIQMVKS